MEWINKLHKTLPNSSVKKLTTFDGSQRSISVFTTVCQLPLFWATFLHSMSLHPTSVRFILILSSNLSLGLSNGLISSGFSTKSPCAIDQMTQCHIPEDLNLQNNKQFLSHVPFKENSYKGCSHLQPLDIDWVDFIKPQPKRHNKHQRFPAPCVTKISVSTGLVAGWLAQLFYKHKADHSNIYNALRSSAILTYLLHGAESYLRS